MLQQRNWEIIGRIATQLQGNCDTMLRNTDLMAEDQASKVANVPERIYQIIGRLDGILWRIEKNDGTKPTYLAIVDELEVVQDNLEGCDEDLRRNIITNNLKNLEPLEGIEELEELDDSEESGTPTGDNQPIPNP